MLILGISLILLALLGAPLFVVIGGAALLGFHSIGLDSVLVVNEMYNKISGNSILLAIPLFTFAGYTLAESGTPNRLINLSKAFLGWLPGGVVPLPRQRAHESGSRACVEPGAGCHGQAAHRHLRGLCPAVQAGRKKASLAALPGQLFHQRPSRFDAE